MTLKADAGATGPSNVVTFPGENRPEGPDAAVVTQERIDQEVAAQQAVDTSKWLTYGLIALVAYFLFSDGGEFFFGED